MVQIKCKASPDSGCARLKEKIITETRPRLTYSLFKAKGN